MSNLGDLLRSKEVNGPLWQGWQSVMGPILQPHPWAVQEVESNSDLENARILRSLAHGAREAVQHQDMEGWQAYMGDVEDRLHALEFVLEKREEADRKVVLLQEITCGGRRLVLRKPIRVGVLLKQGTWHHYYDELEVTGFGESETASLDAFAEDFIACWDAIAKAADERLTHDARELKTKLLLLVGAEEMLPEPEDDMPPEIAEAHGHVDVRDLYRLGTRYLERDDLAADLGAASTTQSWFGRLNAWIADHCKRTPEEMVADFFIKHPQRPPAELVTLAREQGVQPVTRFEDLLGTGPDDFDVDEFIKGLGGNTAGLDRGEPCGTEDILPSHPSQAHRWEVLTVLPTDYTDYGGLLKRWENANEAYPDCSCGCKWWAPLYDEERGGEDLDWGVCLNPSEPRRGLLTWEHQAGKGCFELEDEHKEAELPPHAKAPPSTCLDALPPVRVSREGVPRTYEHTNMGGGSGAEKEPEPLQLSQAQQAGGRGEESRHAGGGIGKKGRGESRHGEGGIEEEDRHAEGGVCADPPGQGAPSPKSNTPCIEVSRACAALCFALAVLCALVGDYGNAALDMAIGLLWWRATERWARHQAGKLT